MKYFSFDIECSDGGKGAICSFGYVVADENFKVLEKHDIVINPEFRFFLTGRKKRPDIQLSYTIEEFKKAPSFPEVYDTIKGMLENKEWQIIGYALGNDADFIRKDCVRYNLPCINYSYFDVQKLIRNTSEDKETISLEKACDRFGIPIDMELHKSDNDAFVTLQIFRKIVESGNCSSEEIISSNENCNGTLNNYINRYSGDRTVKKNIIKPNPKGKDNCIINGTVNKMLFIRFIKYVYPYNPRSLNKPLKGKKVCVSENYERTHFKEMIHIIQLICDLGGRYTTSSSESDLFLTYNDDEGKGRLGNVKEDAIVVSLESFLLFNGTSIESVEHKNPKDIVYLENDKYSTGRY